MANLGGRPKKLNDELITKAQEYLESLDDTVNTGLPTVEGLAIHLGISRDTVYAWDKENEQFSDIVSELKAKQGQKLIQNALKGSYNASIAKLILSGKHGYVEKTESDIKVQEVQPILGGTSKQNTTEDIKD